MVLFPAAVAYDSYDIEYHLTPDGWKKGKSDTFGFPDPDSNPNPPDDRLLTMHKSMRQSSGWSEEHITWTETWRSPAISADDLVALRKKYPRPS